MIDTRIFLCGVLALWGVMSLYRIMYHKRRCFRFELLMKETQIRQTYLTRGRFQRDLKCFKFSGKGLILDLYLGDSCRTGPSTSPRCFTPAPTAPTRECTSAWPPSTASAPSSPERRSSKSQVSHCGLRCPLDMLGKGNSSKILCRPFRHVPRITMKDSLQPRIISVPRQMASRK